MQQEKVHKSAEDEQSFPSRVEKYGRKRKASGKAKKHVKKKKKQTEFMPANIILWAFLLMVISIFAFVLLSY
jgi:hypothetical protein